MVGLTEHAFNCSSAARAPLGLEQPRNLKSTVQSPHWFQPLSTCLVLEQSPPLCTPHASLCTLHPWNNAAIRWNDVRISAGRAVAGEKHTVPKNSSLHAEGELGCGAVGSASFPGRLRSRFESNRVPGCRLKVAKSGFRAGKMALVSCARFPGLFSHFLSFLFHSACTQGKKYPFPSQCP